MIPSTHNAKNYRLKLSRSAVVVGLCLSIIAVAHAKEPLGMSQPVACVKIHGFANFEALPDSKLTPDDKLMIYYEPNGHTIERTKTGFRALLSEDGRLRKKGSKDAIWKKEKMFVYEAANTFPPYQIYLKTDVSLKGLPPGDYEIDLTLHDDLAKPDATITKSVGFTIYRPEESKKKG